MEHEEVPILTLEDEKDIDMATPSEAKFVIPCAPLYCNAICSFSQQHNDALESEKRMMSAMKLCGLVVSISLVMVIEFIGGLKANSLVVMTDAAHLLTKVAGFLISLFAVWASGWEAMPYQSFGFQRLEVLGALLSMQLIWVVSGILIYQAIDRILHKDDGVNSGLMFATAAFGFLVNLIMVRWQGHDHSHHFHNHSHHACHSHDHQHHHPIQSHKGKDLHATNEEEETPLFSSRVNTNILNINVQGAYMHLMSDLIQSIGVMIAGAFIWAKSDWLVVDLICAH